MKEKITAQMIRLSLEDFSKGGDKTIRLSECCNKPNCVNIQSPRRIPPK